MKGLIGTATAAAVNDALSQPTDAGALARLLTAPGAVVAEDDPLLAAKMRGFDYKNRLLAEHGGVISAQQAADLLGISRQAVDKRRRTGTLLAVPRGEAFAYPIWQFGQDGPLPGLSRVLKALSVEGPWTKLSFFLTGDLRLEGVTPLDALRAGQVEEAVRAAAAYGAHGAA